MTSLLRILVLSVWPLVAVGAGQSIQGESGKWRVLRPNSGDIPAAARDSSSPRSTVARALQAAGDGDFVAFRACFQPDDGSATDRIRMRFDGWKRFSDKYAFSILEEAVLTNSETSTLAGVAAVSVIPSGLRLPEQWSGQPANLRAEVVFARQTGNTWKLVPDVPDRKIEQTLARRASYQVYRERDFSKGEVSGTIKEHREAVLDGMRKRGASLGDIASMKATFQIRDDRATITNWIQWTNYFKAVVLDPPAEFDMRENRWIADFSHPVSACRSYLLAIHVGDGKTIFKHADASGAEWLKRAGITEENPTGRSYHFISNKLTRVTILLTAGMRSDGKDYAMVLWRGQNSESPTNGPISLQTTIFMRQHNWVTDRDTYLLTGDLRDSALAHVCSAAGLRSYGLWSYDNFRSELEQSEFPAHFHAIR